MAGNRRIDSGWSLRVCKKEGSPPSVAEHRNGPKLPLLSWPCPHVHRASPVLLISTDFDGTLVEHGNPAPFSPLLVEISHRPARTRRALGDQHRPHAALAGWTGCKPFDVPVHPDFAITAEREVYRPTPDGRGWEDFGDWNAICARRHRELFDDRRAAADGDHPRSWNAKPTRTPLRRATPPSRMATHGNSPGSWRPDDGRWTASSRVWTDQGGRCRIFPTSATPST